MGDQRKITVHVPTELLEAAQAATGQGVSETVREGLKALAVARAYRNLKALRGKVKFSIDLKELRKDREIRLPPWDPSKES